MCILNIESCFLLCSVENETEQEKTCPGKKNDKTCSEGQVKTEMPIFDHESYVQLWKIHIISSFCSFIYSRIHANNYLLSAMLRTRGKNAFALTDLRSDGRKENNPKLHTSLNRLLEGFLGRGHLSCPSLRT